MTDERFATVIAGRLRIKLGYGQPFPVVSIHALDLTCERLLAKGFSGPGGEFSLILPISGDGTAGALEVPVRLRVQALHPQCDAGVPLNEMDVRAVLGQTVLVDIDVPAEAVQGAEGANLWAEPAAALLHPDALEYLRTQVRALVAEGGLHPTAVEALEGLIAPLAWLDSLTADARGVLRGQAPAADRLRAALLNLGAGSDLPEEEQGASDELYSAEIPAEMRIVDSNGVSLLVAAATWAADDGPNAQAMLNGLSAALWPRAVLENLLQAGLEDPANGSRSAMQTLMGGPGPGLGLPLGWNTGVLGLGGWGGPGPGVPGWPGDSKLPEKRPPIKVHPNIFDLVPKYRSPINEKPTQRELCLLLIPLRIRQAQQRAPRYEIRTISNPAACPGWLITLTGVNFGPTGAVFFPAKGSLAEQPAPFEHWTDTSIRVRVPDWASPGAIRLSIFVETLDLCGKLYAIYRLGNSLPYFHGGVPVVHSFTVEGEPSQAVVDPNAEVTAKFVTSIGNGTLASLSVFDGGTRLVHMPGLPGGTHTLTFRVPATEKPLALRVVVSVGNDKCGGSEAVIQLLVAQQPKLRINSLEVTQGIQRLDNTVRLAARRRTLVRVYLTSGLSNFTYVDGLSQGLPGVIGTLTIWQGSQKLAVVTPTNAPFIVRGLAFPYTRQNPNGSLNFLLPSYLLSGALRLEVRVEISMPLPPGVECKTNNCATQRTVVVNFEPVHGISLVRVLINDASRGLPAPTQAEFQMAILGAVSRFPVPDDGWQVRVAPGLQSITVNRNLNSKEGWDDLLEDLDDVAGDMDDGFAHRWVGLLPAVRPNIDTFATKGKANHYAVDRLWPLSNDYLTMVVVAGRPEVFAHELGHTFDMDHAGCPFLGQPGAPENVDPGLPPTIEEVAIDLLTNQTFQAGQTGDLMSYCPTFGLWPSIVTWHRLLDKLR
jgi:hypothetical protein